MFYFSRALIFYTLSNPYSLLLTVFSLSFISYIFPLLLLIFLLWLLFFIPFLFHCPFTFFSYFSIPSTYNKIIVLNQFWSSPSFSYFYPIITLTVSYFKDNFFDISLPIFHFTPLYFLVSFLFRHPPQLLQLLYIYNHFFNSYHNLYIPNNFIPLSFIFLIMILVLDFLLYSKNSLC